MKQHLRRRRVIKIEDAVLEFQKARTRYHTDWKLTDEVLRRLCRDNPTHSDQSSVNAKTMLIGRGFSSGIERKIKSDGRPGSSLAQLAQHLAAHHQKIDRIIASLPKRKFPKFRDLNAIGAAHDSLVQTIRKITRDQHAARSFVSKYLHFHCSVVPIYDTIVAANLRKRIRWQRDLKSLVDDIPGDEEYCRFLARLWSLAAKLKTCGINPTTRELDAFLYSTKPIPIE